MKVNTKKLILAALFAALSCVATMSIRIPTPGTGGYIHPGDAIVILCGVILGPMWGFLAAGIGSCMSDLLGGYLMYVPITFVIKGLVAFSSAFAYQKLGKTEKSRYLGVARRGESWTSFSLPGGISSANTLCTVQAPFPAFPPTSFRVSASHPLSGTLPHPHGSPGSKTHGHISPYLKNKTTVSKYTASKACLCRFSESVEYQLRLQAQLETQTEHKRQRQALDASVYYDNFSYFLSFII